MFLNTQRHRTTWRHSSLIVWTAVLLASLFIVGFRNREDSHSPNENRPEQAIQTMDLLNGLRITTAKPVNDERATIHLLIKSGFLSDPRGKEGLTLLTAQSILMANPKSNPARRKDELDFLGASLNVEINADSTVFSAQAPKARIESVFSLLANLIVHPAFSEEMIAGLKKDLVAGSSNQTNGPVEAADQELSKLMFRGDACSRSRQNDLASITNLSMSEVLDFHSVHYRPNNTELILVTDIPMNQLAEVLREKFGSWVKARPPDRPAVSLPQVGDSIVRVMDWQDGGRAIVLLGYPLPSRQSPDYQALKALNELLEGIGNQSRLGQRFADLNSQQISLQSKCYFAMDCSSLRIRVEVPTTLVNTTIQRVLDAIASTKTTPASAEELKLVKSHLLEEREQQIRSDEGLANLIEEIGLFGLGKDYVSNLSSRLELLTSEKIQEVSKTYLTTTRMALLVLGARDKIGSELKGFEIQNLSLP